MKLRLLKNLVLVGIIGVFAVSCMDEVDPYEPPTKAEELELLDSYLAQLEDSGLDVDTTDLGVYYVVDSIGEGAFPMDGDTCTVNYTGFFLNGDVFDRSGANPFSLVLGEQMVISGWEDGLKVLNKGAKGYLVIPSNLAYGENGYSSIPPNTTIVFNIEMLDIE